MRVITDTGMNVEASQSRPAAPFQLVRVAMCKPLADILTNACLWPVLGGINRVRLTARRCRNAEPENLAMQGAKQAQYWANKCFRWNGTLKR